MNTMKDTKEVGKQIGVALIPIANANQLLLSMKFCLGRALLTWREDIMRFLTKTINDMQDVIAKQSGVTVEVNRHVNMVELLLLDSNNSPNKAVDLARLVNLASGIIANTHRQIRLAKTDPEAYEQFLSLSNNDDLVDYYLTDTLIDKLFIGKAYSGFNGLPAMRKYYDEVLSIGNCEIAVAGDYMNKDTNLTEWYMALSGLTNIQFGDRRLPVEPLHRSMRRNAATSLQLFLVDDDLGWIKTNIPLVKAVMACHRDCDGKERLLIKIAQLYLQQIYPMLKFELYSYASAIVMEITIACSDSEPNSTMDAFRKLGECIDAIADVNMIDEQILKSIMGNMCCEFKTQQQAAQSYHQSELHSSGVNYQDISDTMRQISEQDVVNFLNKMIPGSDTGTVGAYGYIGSIRLTGIRRKIFCRQLRRLLHVKQRIVENHL